MFALIALIAQALVLVFDAVSGVILLAASLVWETATTNPVAYGAFFLVVINGAVLHYLLAGRHGHAAQRRALGR